MVLLWIETIRMHVVQSPKWIFDKKKRFKNDPIYPYIFIRKFVFGFAIVVVYDETWT